MLFSRLARPFPEAIIQRSGRCANGTRSAIISRLPRCPFKSITPDALRLPGPLASFRFLSSRSLGGGTWGAVKFRTSICKDSSSKLADSFPCSSRTPCSSSANARSSPCILPSRRGLPKVPTISARKASRPPVRILLSSAGPTQEISAISTSRFPARTASGSTVQFMADSADLVTGIETEALASPRCFPLALNSPVNLPSTAWAAS